MRCHPAPAYDWLLERTTLATDRLLYATRWRHLRDGRCPKRGSVTAKGPKKWRPSTSLELHRRLRSLLLSGRRPQRSHALMRRVWLRWKSFGHEGSCEWPRHWYAPWPRLST